jgi:hypothetical protein
MKWLPVDVFPTVQKNRQLRNILLISLVVAILFPATEYLVSYPRFAQLLIHSTENAAERAATHLTKNLVRMDRDITDETLPLEFLDELKKITNDFQIEKIKIFTKSGQVIYSTNQADQGTLNRHDYFHNQVASGEVFTKVVQKGKKTMEGRAVTADVVETYIPIIHNGHPLHPH